MKKLISFLSLLFFAHLCAENVVIVGGGPSGLASAIEAKTQGADVTVVEKRNKFSRYQMLFLDSNSLRLLKKWNVAIPQMEVVEDIGFVRINVLEEALENRCKELGIRKIYGECKSVDKLLHLVKTKDQEIAYDLLIAADGMHSPTREALGIPAMIFGKAVASIAFLRFDSEDIGISNPLDKNTFFIRKITAPSATVIFVQGKNQLPSEQMLITAREFGWAKEAKLLQNGEAMFFDGIEVILQQAKAFSNQEASAILVGDAAATGSFFQGMGANTAFMTAELAGQFVKSKSYADFNQSMKATTDALIEDSRYLFDLFRN